MWTTATASESVPAATQKDSQPHFLDRSPEKQLRVLLPKRRHGLRFQIHFLSEIRTESELPDSCDAANPGSQLGTWQSRIGGFVRPTTHGRKLLSWYWQPDETPGACDNAPRRCG